MASESGTLGPVRTFALAAGGMVGGGIYIALAVVIETAGQWAWLSFLIAGIAATITARSYARLTNTFHASGGAFDFLEELDRKSWAGTLSWLLILGYVLTISVYGYAFGNYLSHAVGGGPVMTRALAVGAIAVLIALNLAGAGKLTSVEVVIVSVNLVILLVVAAAGVLDWSPEKLVEGIAPLPASAAMIGAAAIFVSYEGFQLLTYEYDEMTAPESWFTPVLVAASASVVAIYVAVALGATMLTGAGTILANQGVALAVAAETAFGFAGLAAMTLAAAFATSAAINSTLFSTAKLSARVADDGEAPEWFAHRNGSDIPDRAVLCIGGLAAGLAVIGSLASLVEAASLVFVVTFLVVNLIAARRLEGPQWWAWGGAALTAVIGLVLCWRLFTEKPFALGFVLLAVIAIFALRPLIVTDD